MEALEALTLKDPHQDEPLIRDLVARHGGGELTIVTTVHRRRTGEPYRVERLAVLCPRCDKVWSVPSVSCTGKVHFGRDPMLSGVARQDCCDCSEERYEAATASTAFAVR